MNLKPDSARSKSLRWESAAVYQTGMQYSKLGMMKACRLQ